MTTEAQNLVWEEIDVWLTDSERALWSSQTEPVLRELATIRRVLWWKKVMSESHPAVLSIRKWDVLQGDQIVFGVLVTHGMARSVECTACESGRRYPEGSEWDIGVDRDCHKTNGYHGMTSIGPSQNFSIKGYHYPRYLAAARTLVNAKLTSLFEETDCTFFVREREEAKQKAEL